MMEKIAGNAALVLVLIFFMPIFAALFGAASGWVVGQFFTDVILGFLSRLGVNTQGLALWQVGMSMGFFGGFLKTSVQTRDVTKKS